MSTTDEPTDLLAGRYGYTHELLAGLTDAELESQIAYYCAKRDRSSGEALYRVCNSLASAHAELVKRTTAA